MSGRVISLNVGLPREVEWNGKHIITGIYKDPVEEPVFAYKHNLVGDAQGDLSVHGGLEKAIYVYPIEHYSYWQKRLSVDNLPWGTFGENITLEGFLEQDVMIGDRFRVGAVHVVVTQPRYPCYKLANKLQFDIIKPFLESGRTGFYLAVEQEGIIHIGDAFELLERPQASMSVQEISRLQYDKTDLEALRRAASLYYLPLTMQRSFQKAFQSASMKS